MNVMRKREVLGIYDIGLIERKGDERSVAALSYDAYNAYDEL